MKVIKLIQNWLSWIFAVRLPTNMSIYAKIAGLSGLFIFAVGLAMSKSLQLIGLGLALIGMLIDWKRVYQTFKSTPVMYCILFFVLYIWVRTAYGIFFETSINFEILIDGARKYSYIVMMPVVGWWLAGNEKAVSRFYLILIVSSLIYIIFFSNINMFEFSKGRTLDRDLPTLLLAYAMYCAIILIWIATFFLRLVSKSGAGSFAKTGICFLLLSSFAVIFLTFVALQARTTTVALILALAITLPCTIYNSLKEKQSRQVRKFTSIMLIIVIVLLSTLVFFSIDPVKDRFNSEKETFNHFLNFKDLTETPTSSFGTRVHLWLLGSELIKEKPWIGHGWGGSELIRAEEDKRGLELKNTVHFHNTVVEAFVAWGIIGSVLLFAVFIIMAKCVFTQWRAKKISQEMFLFLVGAAIIVIVSGMTHSFGIRQTTWTYTTMWAGVAFSYCFKPIIIQKENGTQNS